MDHTVKLKLCWNCEGRVQFDVENCPYCGVYLSPSIIKEAPAEVPPPLYQKNMELEEEGLALGDKGVNPNNFFEPKNESGDEPKESRDVILPLALLLSGSIFFIFGIVLFLFSKEGTLTLKWEASFFPLYLIGGAILFVFGWRLLNKLRG